MTTVQFLVPGSLDTPTGGYRYDKAMVIGLQRLGWEVQLPALADSFPTPDAAALTAAQALLSRLPAEDPVVIDGLALAPLEPWLPTERRLIALIHHPLADETGLDHATRTQWFHQERDALARVAAVIVTSPATAQELTIRYGVPAEKISVVLPGTERPAPLDTTAPPAKDGALLCVATLIPRKGHSVLLEALGRLTHLDWHLHCVGSQDRDPATAAALLEHSQRLGLTNRLSWLGEVAPEALTDHYRRAQLFVLPSFHEGYGMVLAEALSHGLAIISTTAGAIPDTVPPDAGLLVPPGDVDALTEALVALLTDHEHRQRCAAAAQAAGNALPTWADSVQRFATVVAGDTT